MEQLLHYVWKHKIFPLHELQTTTGLPVEVIDTGLPNSDSGPDFFNAKLKIGGTLWVGNVEIHTASSDWFRHGHDRDIAYDSVILHIATEIDCEIYRSNGEPVPQLRLPCPERNRFSRSDPSQERFSPDRSGIYPSALLSSIRSPPRFSTQPEHHRPSV